MGKPRYKRSVANMLVDKKFQLKYTLFVMVLCLAIYGVLGGLYYSEMAASTELMDINKSVSGAFTRAADKPASQDDEFLKSLDLPAGDDEYVKSTLKELDEEIKPELASRDTRAVYVMLAAVAFLVLALAVAGIYMTHKVAGPLYALTLFMNAAIEGRWKSIRPFRQGDEFVWLAESFQKLVRSIKVTHERELEALKLIESHAREHLPPEVMKELTTVIADKEEYLTH